MESSKLINQRLFEYHNQIVNLMLEDNSEEVLKKIKYCQDEISNLKELWREVRFHELDEIEKNIYISNKKELDQLMNQIYEIRQKINLSNLKNDEMDLILANEFNLRKKADLLRRYFWSDFEKYEHEEAMKNLRNKMR